MIMIFFCAFRVGLWIGLVEYVYASLLLFHLSLHMSFANVIFYVDSEG